jgi:aspartyl-tRNA(Asn)/glutamyl-tRNA(Gln) amidotransferase subunit A
MCVYALGSDTGGSIRQPASFCGVVGLKPTYGSVSRYGLVAFASSLDQIGPITKTVEDAKIVYEAICGKDKNDSTSVDFKSNESENLKGIKAGIPEEYFADGLDPEVKNIVEEAIKKFEKLGIKTEKISLPNIKYAIPAYYLVCTSEASANLARFDGIRYGLSKQDGGNLLEVYTDSKSNGFGQEVKRRIMLGTYALSSGYYDAYYLKAQKVRTLIKQDFEKAFDPSADGVDVIFSPTSPTPAFKIGENTGDPLAMYLGDIYTVSVNLAGVPAISIPVGETENGLPVGLQVIGRHFEDNKILALAKLYEQS